MRQKEGGKERGSPTDICTGSYVNTQDRQTEKNHILGLQGHILEANPEPRRREKGRKGCPSTDVCGNSICHSEKEKTAYVSIHRRGANQPHVFWNVLQSRFLKQGASWAGLAGWLSGGEIPNL